MGHELSKGRRDFVYTSSTVCPRDLEKCHEQRIYCQSSCINNVLEKN
jgi:hypothetical protein